MDRSLQDILDRQITPGTQGTIADANTVSRMEMAARSLESAATKFSQSADRTPHGTIPTVQNQASFLGMAASGAMHGTTVGMLPGVGLPATAIGAGVGAMAGLGYAGYQRAVDPVTGILPRMHAGAAGFMGVDDHFERIQQNQMIQAQSIGHVYGGSHLSPMGRGLSATAAAQHGRGIRGLAGETGLSADNLMQLSHMAAETGLMDMAQDPDRMTENISNLVKAVGSIVQVTEDPDVRNAMSTVGQMHRMGLGSMEAAGAVTNARAYARMMGMSVGDAIGSHGMRGAQRAAQHGLAGGVGVSHGVFAGAMGMAGMQAQDPLNLALVGGEEGMQEANLGMQSLFMERIAPMLLLQGARGGEWDPAFVSSLGRGGAIRPSDLTAEAAGASQSDIREILLRQNELTSQLVREMSPAQMMATTLQVAKGMQQETGARGLAEVFVSMGMDRNQAMALQRQFEDPAVWDTMTQHAQIEQRERELDMADAVAARPGWLRRTGRGIVGRIQAPFHAYSEAAAFHGALAEERGQLEAFGMHGLGDPRHRTLFGQGDVWLAEQAGALGAEPFAGDTPNWGLERVDFTGLTTGVRDRRAGARFRGSSTLGLLGPHIESDDLRAAVAERDRFTENILRSATSDRAGRGGRRLQVAELAGDNIRGVSKLESRLALVVARSRQTGNRNPGDLDAQIQTILRDLPEETRTFFQENRDLLMTRASDMAIGADPDTILEGAEATPDLLDQLFGGPGVAALGGHDTYRSGPSPEQRARSVLRGFTAEGAQDFAHRSRGEGRDALREDLDRHAQMADWGTEEYAADFFQEIGWQREGGVGAVRGAGLADHALRLHPLGWAAAGARAFGRHRRQREMPLLQQRLGQLVDPVAGAMGDFGDADPSMVFAALMGHVSEGHMSEELREFSLEHREALGRLAGHYDAESQERLAELAGQRREGEGLADFAERFFERGGRVRLGQIISSQLPAGLAGMDLPTDPEAAARQILDDRSRSSEQRRAAQRYLDDPTAGAVPFARSLGISLHGEAAVRGEAFDPVAGLAPGSSDLEVLSQARQQFTTPSGRAGEAASMGEMMEPVAQAQLSAARRMESAMDKFEMWLKEHSE